MRVALYQPEIAGNVGAVMRLGACLGAAVDLIEPMGFAWDDPEVAVPWPPLSMTPDGRPILSDRDQSNPTLDDLVARLRR